MRWRRKATTRKPSASIRARIFPALFDSTASGLMMANVFSMRPRSIRGRRRLPSPAVLHRLPRMKNFFESSDRRELLDRLDRLRPDAARLWGKMDPAQMCAHCAIALEVAAGDVTKKQAFIGKVLAPFVRNKVVRGTDP